jgi:Protein of unknown function (DUF2911)
MNHRKLFAIVLFVIMAFSISVPMTRADVSNQKTKLTFNDAVEIPGQMLPAGTYWFVVLNGLPSRNVVQIFNADQSVLYATLLTVPSERMQASDGTILTFAERPPNQPEALLTWFYPGMTTGHEFIYPKNEAQELASDMHQEVVSEPGE